MLWLPPGSRPWGGQIRDWDGLHDSASEFARRNDLELQRMDTGCTRATYDHDHDDDGGGPSSMTMTQISTTSHGPPADSGIVRNARPSPIVRRVEEEVDCKVERDGGQALG